MATAKQMAVRAAPVGKWLSELPQVGAENERLDELDKRHGAKETSSYRIGTRLVRKNASGNNVFGMVVQVVSRSDGANEYNYAWVWAAWMDTAPNDALTAPGDTANQLHCMRKNFRRFNKLKDAPNFPRELFIEKWYAHPQLSIRAHVLPGAQPSVQGLCASHLEHWRPSWSTQRRNQPRVNARYPRAV
eukprot:COSAG02_NODE_2378_length_9005_cov_4.989782_3_plen_189_part_00